MDLVARAIEILLAMLYFCWKVFYWGSFTATMMAFTGCVFGGYYLFKERHSRDYWKVTASEEWIGSAIIVALAAFVPLLNTCCALYLFTEHETIVHEAIEKIEVKHGFTKTESV